MLGVPRWSPRSGTGLASVRLPRRFRVPPCLAGDWPACWRGGFLAGPSPR